MINFENKILVTGGLGFVGSNLVDSLLSLGYKNITVIDDLSSESSSKSYMKSEVKYLLRDIVDIPKFEEELEVFDTVFHLAALARLQPSFLNPLRYFEVNSLATFYLLDFLRRKNPEAKVVYAGSSTAFAGALLNPYAFAKHTGEDVCRLFSENYNINTAIARFFNVYGDRQPITGEWATVIGKFEQQYLNGEQLTVVGDGMQKRDFTHISDIISGLICLSEGNHRGEIFSLGTGRNYTLFDVAYAFKDDIKFIPPRPGEARETLADISAMTNATNWEPQSNLMEYIEKFKKDNLNN